MVLIGIQDTFSLHPMVQHYVAPWVRKGTRHKAFPLALLTPLAA